MQVETVKIKSKHTAAGFLIINKSDFDESVHKLHGIGDEFDDMNKEELQEYLNVLEVAFDGRASEAKLRELCRK